MFFSDAENANFSFSVLKMKIKISGTAECFPIFSQQKYFVKNGSHNFAVPRKKSRSPPKVHSTKFGFSASKKSPKKLQSQFEPYIILYYSNWDCKAPSVFELRSRGLQRRRAHSLSRILWGSGGRSVYFAHRGSCDFARVRREMRVC